MNMYIVYREREVQDTILMKHMPDIVYCVCIYHICNKALMDMNDIGIKSICQIINSGIIPGSPRHIYYLGRHLCF